MSGVGQKSGVDFWLVCSRCRAGSRESTFGIAAADVGDVGPEVGRRLQAWLFGMSDLVSELLWSSGDFPGWKSVLSAFQGGSGILESVSGFCSITQNSGLHDVHSMKTAMKTDVAVGYLYHF